MDLAVEKIGRSRVRLEEAEICQVSMIREDAMNLQVSVEVTDHDALLAELLDENGHLKGPLALGKGIVLSPQFTAIKTKRAIGATDILQFVLSVPVGIGTGVAANALYSWLMKNKVPRAKIETTEIVLTEEKEQTIRLIVKTLTRE